MKSNKLVKELGILVFAIAPLAYYFTLWGSLPETVPVHFDGQGNPDNFGSKYYIALTLFFLSMGVYFLLLFVNRIDPKRNFTVFRKTFYKLRFILSLFFSTICFIVIVSVQQGRTPISLLYVIIAFLISILGNYASNIRPNYYIGIRNPWTLEHESIWKKTHYFTGKLWFFSGILLALLVIIFPAEYKIYVFISTIIILAIIPYAYSYSIYLKIGNKQKIEPNEN